jgi:hypothetical protein
MMRSIASKVAWVGRTASMVFGLALVLGLVFGIASATFGANGNSWLLGRPNVATAITTLGGAVGVDGPMVRIANNNAGTDDTALDLKVQSGEPPMTVSSPTKVANLNADQLDGKDQRAFADVNELGAQLITRTFGPLPVERTFTSEGGTLLILASGSGYRGGAEMSSGRIGMDVKFDGSLRGRANGFSQGFNVHETFVDEYIILEGVSAGTHTLRLERTYDSSDCDTDEETSSDYCTATNSNDFFAATVIELSD